MGILGSPRSLRVGQQLLQKDSVKRDSMLPRHEAVDYLQCRSVKRGCVVYTQDLCWIQRPSNGCF